MFIGNNIIAFAKQFQKPEACYQYLAHCQWAKGYTCKKCGHGKYSSGKKPYARRCTRCQYDESPTAGTLFHKVKFPIEKAFYIVFLVSTSKKGISSYELGRRLGLRQTTCYYFKRKVIEGMSLEPSPLLTGQVEVDECYVGGPEEGNPGRSKGRKKGVVLALKTSTYGINRAYGQVINGSGTKELKPFFDRYIDREAVVKTDRWRGYRPLKETYRHLRQYPSNRGKTLKLLHRYVMMFKSWLRGIHHSVDHLQVYLNEYSYRFNRLKYKKTLFHDLIVYMVKAQPIVINELKWKET